MNVLFLGSMRWTAALTFAVGGFWAGCGPIPTAPEVDITDIGGERVYANDEWGFQITIPGSDDWGFTAQTSFRQRLANGLPSVEVVISKNVDATGNGDRPTLTLRPRALALGTNAGILATMLEEEFRSAFLGYSPQQKQGLNLPASQLGGDSVRAIEWEFTSRIPVGLFSRFIVTVLVDKDRRGYVFIGAGTPLAFPVDEYKQIASTLRFTH